MEGFCIAYFLNPSNLFVARKNNPGPNKLAYTIHIADTDCTLNGNTYYFTKSLQVVILLVYYGSVTIRGVTCACRVPVLRFFRAPEKRRLLLDS